MPRSQRGSQFLRYAAPILDTLKALGGSGTPREVTDRVIEQLNIPRAEQEVTTSTGVSRVRNQIAWARNYLADAGYIDRSQRGVWSLTPSGRHAMVNATHARSQFARARMARGGTAAEREAEVTAVSERVGYEARLLSILRKLPAAGFERVCQRLLRESGFQQVEVTGRSGDGGIDGHGILEINPLVTFKVLFQCKRYKDGKTVTPTQVRDFRGAMQGRADKGFILTTGSFTSAARREATREGAPPIELVDAEKLTQMFARAQLGLRPVQTYDVDDAFFDQFRTR